VVDDIVYVVGPGEPNDELRYSLRSLRNLPHGQVWIVGHKPRWVRNVQHLPTRQARTKYENSTANLLTACTHPDVSARFVYFNDDFFVWNPVAEVPVLHRGPVEPVRRSYERRYGRGPVGKSWRGGMGQTAALLDSWGVDPVLSYELHIPMLLDKQRMVDAIRKASPAGIVALHKRTLYGNLYRIGGECADDCKVFSTAHRWTDDQPFLSTSDRVFRAGRVRQAIEARFPKPSPYEEAP
jgi:hypothetical protein